MARTTYRWTPERIAHRLFPVAVVLGWWLAWSSPPGEAVRQWVLATVPNQLVLPGALLAMALVVTWGTIAFFHRLDETGKPAFLARFKIQTPFSDPLRPTPAQAARNIGLNHLILVPSTFIAAWLLYLRGWDPTAPMASWWWTLLTVVAMALITEVAFFAGHYWLHTKWLYKHVHKVHHRYRASTAWSAQYAHPFEYVVGNIVPIGLPMVLLAPDLLTIVLFGLVAVLNTQLVHSGYQLPFAPWAIPHDLHHYKVTVNYGSMGIMDRLFKTRMRRLPDGKDVVMGEDDAVSVQERAAK